MKMDDFVMEDVGWSWFNTLLFILVIIMLSVKFYMPIMQQKRCGPCVNESTINTYCNTSKMERMFNSIRACNYNVMRECNYECVNVTRNNEFNLTTLSEYMNLTNISNGGELSK